MAVLVTGGAGYIGSVAVEQLLKAGERVVVYDNLSTGHRDAIHPDATFVEGDILDTAAVAEALRAHAIDTVMHFAAFIVVGESCAEPGMYFHNNTTGAHAVLRAMRETGVERFIFSSTAAVYGHPDSVPIREDALIRPLNPYGLSKRMVEQIVEWYGRAHGLRYAVLRYFNAAGASPTFGEDHDPETHLIPNVLMAATGERPALTVFGNDYPTPDGTCIRDYIHVLDLTGAHLEAMRYLRDGGEPGIFNLGNAVGTSVLEVAEAVRRATGRDVPVEFAGRRDGDSIQLIASSDKAREHLGWTPARSDVDTIVRDAWAWRQAHPDGYVR